MKNPTDSVSGLILRFLAENDFRSNTKRAFGQDLRSFVSWFESTNKERFQINRMSTADVSGYKEHLHRNGKSISTVNGALISIRRCLFMACG